MKYTTDFVVGKLYFGRYNTRIKGVVCVVVFRRCNDWQYFNQRLGHCSRATLSDSVWRDGQRYAEGWKVRECSPLEKLVYGLREEDFQ